jgi:hypothetical protein
MATAFGIPSLDRRQAPLIDYLLQLGKADAAQLERWMAFRHYDALILPAISRGGGPHEVRRRILGTAKSPFIHPSEGPPPPEIRGRI